MSESLVNQERSPGGISQRHLAIGAAVLLFFLVLGVVGYKFFLSDALATLSRSEGDTDRDTSDAMLNWFDATPGDDFFAGDGARTQAQASAYFRLGTGALLTLKPSSQIRFQSSAGGRGAIGLHVEVGEADVQTKAGTVTLDSQFGPIVINPNTTVTMRRNGANMVVKVELGSIQIGDRQQTVAAGSAVQLEIGGIVLDVNGGDSSNEQKTTDDETEQDDSLELKVGDGVSSADLMVSPGNEFTVHDPSPPTSIGFQTGALCKGPVRLVAGKQTTEAKKQPALSFAQGTHTYELRCLDAPEVVVSKGSFRVMRDAGTRQLPAFTPSAQVTTDGRRYTVMYQQRLPQVTVTWPSAPQAASYTLTVGERTIKTSAPSYTFNSGVLPGGTYRLVFSAASTPARQSRPTTVAIVYDSQAPAARVSDPPDDFESGSGVKVAGQALPGWTVSLEGKELEVDSQRRFSTEFNGSGALPIAFSHPDHGLHYYLRRPRTSSP